MLLRPILRIVFPSGSMTRHRGPIGIARRLVVEGFALAVVADAACRSASASRWCSALDSARSWEGMVSNSAAAAEAGASLAAHRVSGRPAGTSLAVGATTAGHTGAEGPPPPRREGPARSARSGAARSGERWPRGQRANEAAGGRMPPKAEAGAARRRRGRRPKRRAGCG